MNMFHLCFLVDGDLLSGCMMLILTFMRNGERGILPTSKGIVIKFILVFVIDFTNSRDDGIIKFCNGIWRVFFYIIYSIIYEPAMAGLLAHFILDERLTKLKLLHLYLVCLE